MTGNAFQPLVRLISRYIFRPWKSRPIKNFPVVVGVTVPPQASKLTVSQVEIGFDILKARDVPVDGASDAGSGVSAAAAPPSVETTVATSGGFSTAIPSGESAAVAAAEGCAGAALLPGGDGGNQEIELVNDKRKRYRLLVKRRLLKRHGEQLSTDASTRKRQLEELYRDVEADLLRSGAKLRKETGKAKSPAMAEA